MAGGFTIGACNNPWAQDYGTYYTSEGNYTRARAYRNASVSTQRTLARNIAASHNTDLKNAYDCICNQDNQAFEAIINKIVAEEAAKERNYNITESEIRSAIETAFESATNSDYATAVVNNYDSSFDCGFKQTFLGGIFSTTPDSAADINAKRLGIKTGKKEQAKEEWGGTVGAAATVGTGAAIGAIFGPPGMIIGAGIGFAVSLLTGNNLFGNGVHKNNKESGVA